MSVPATLRSTVPPKRATQDIEAVLKSMIPATNGRGQMQGSRDRWEGMDGRLKARRIGEQTYLVQYRYDDGSGQREYLFEVNFIA
jgi:hypothetical protein